MALAESVFEGPMPVSMDVLIDMEHDIAIDVWIRITTLLE